MRGKAGVCSLTKDNLHFETINVSQFCNEDCCQLAAVKFKFNSSESILVLTVYKIPGHNFDSFLDYISQSLHSIVDKAINTIVIGDNNVGC